MKSFTAESFRLQRGGVFITCGDDYPTEILPIGSLYVCHTDGTWWISSGSGWGRTDLSPASVTMRNNPSGSLLAFIERIRIQFTTIVAFTTPVTAGRRLALYRGSGATPSGGTGLAAAVAKDSSGAASNFNSANNGDIRIATTGALTVTGITFESQEIKTASLVHVGAAGGHYEAIWEFAATESAPFILRPGQLLGIRNPAAMDAAGTWQLSVNVDWHEATAYEA